MPELDAVASNSPVCLIKTCPLFLKPGTVKAIALQVVKIEDYRSKFCSTITPERRWVQLRSCN